MKERSGEVIELVLPDKLVIFEVFPIALADIQPGSYIGTAHRRQTHGPAHQCGAQRLRIAVLTGAAC